MGRRLQPNNSVDPSRLIGAPRGARTAVTVTRGRSARSEEQRERQQADPEGDESEVDQLDDAHIARGARERCGRCGIGQVRFRPVIVPAVVQSHPASVAQARTRLRDPTASTSSPEPDDVPAQSPSAVFKLNQVD